MGFLLAWTRDLTLPQAALASLVVNGAVFALALALGEVLAWAYRDRPVAAPPAAVSSLERALAASCVLLNASVMLAGWWLFRAGILRVDAGGGPLRWSVDALVLLLVMDLAMYVTHRLAHVPVLFRWVHGIHHRFTEPRPLTLFVLHPLEVLGFGALWIAVLCAHPFSLGGMLAYLFVNTAFGTLGHVGVEPLPTGWVRWPVLGVIGTSTFHARHHQRPTTNFGFYSAVWDRLFGSLDPAYADDFARRPARAEDVGVG